MNITSNADESVTLTVGAVSACIRGDTWREANRVAHLLGSLLDGEREATDTLHSVERIAEKIRIIENKTSALLGIKDVLDRLDRLADQ